ncbi:MAG: type II toxin-antitoxin system Phd/YefM family antitoxin [Gemmatimonadota bacterium]
MIIQATITELLRNFSDYVNRVAYRGERFVVTRGGKPVAELSPVSSGRRLGDLPSLFDSLPRLDEEDAAAFARDLERFRLEPGADGPLDPWES